jgi:hypothetical protein
MTSGFDLAHAAKHFKFALIPKVSSELATSDVIELMAHDERSYKHWYYFPVAVYPSSSLRESSIDVMLYYPQASGPERRYQCV